MLIGMEGPDGGGKTTLINRFRLQHPEFEYFKPVPEEGPKGQTEEYMFKTTKELFVRSKNGENIVNDRFNFLSEEVYGPICRDGSILSTRSFNELFYEFIDDLDPILIYCRPNSETIIENVRKSRQMDGVKDYINLIIGEYDRVMAVIGNSGLDYYVYDYETDPDATQVLFYLDCEITRRRNKIQLDKALETGEEVPKEQYEKVGDPFTCLVEECAELSIESTKLATDCNELIKKYSKYKRFGPDGHSRLDLNKISNIDNLLTEMDHVQRRIEEVRGFLLYKASLKI